MSFGLFAIATAIVVGLAAFGSAIGQGITASKAMESLARQPEAAGSIRTSLILSLAFMETLTIFALVIAFLLLGKIPDAAALLTLG